MEAADKAAAPSGTPKSVILRHETTKNLYKADNGQEKVHHWRSEWRIWGMVQRRRAFVSSGRYGNILTLVAVLDRMVMQKWKRCFAVNLHNAIGKKAVIMKEMTKTPIKPNITCHDGVRTDKTMQVRAGKALWPWCFVLSTKSHRVFRQNKVTCLLDRFFTLPYN